MKEKAKAMTVASFIGDSVALGVHWIYNTEEIQEKFGRVEQLLKPDQTPYHHTKDSGEFTHYGDQTLVLLESVVDCSGFDLDHFARKWRELFSRYNGYYDSATKAALANFAEGKDASQSGSQSTDLAGAARIAPLAYCFREDEAELVAAVRAQTAMTHNHPQVIDSAEFFARVVWRVLRGDKPVSAMREVQEAYFPDNRIAVDIKDGLKSTELPSISAILYFGQDCYVEGALASTVHLIAKYEDRLKDALIENVMCGGDSAARGMLAGMVLGAYLGGSAIPSEWISSLKRYQYIMDLLKKLDEGDVA